MNVALRKLILSCSIALGAVPLLRSSESEKIDLERQTPVPEGAPIPLADFLRPPFLSAPQLNRAGTHIAALVNPGEDKFQLLVFELATKKLETLVASGDKDLYGVEWLSDRRLTFHLAIHKTQGLGLMGADVGLINSPYPLIQYSAAWIQAVPRKDPTHPRVWMRSDFESDKDEGIMVLDTDVHTGRMVNLYGGNVHDHDFAEVRDNNDHHILRQLPSVKEGIGGAYLSNKDGEVEFAIRWIDGRRVLFFLDGSTWKRSPVDLESIRLVSTGEKPAEIVVSLPGEADHPWEVRFMDARTGAAGQLILQDKEYDFTGGLYRDPNTGLIVGAHYQRKGPQVMWLEDSYKKLQAALDSLFPGLVVHILDYNDKLTVFLVETYSDRQPPVFHFVDLEHRTAGVFQASRPWIDGKRMRPMNPIRFKTRDGRKLDAYLTLPEGASKANPPPMIVMPHGGPWVRDTWGFDGVAQYFASRGYAVLQPNYRGSPGTRWMFADEDAWAFRKMHDDVTDAAKAVVTSGLADGNRLAILGGSFGGYLALSGAAYEGEFYKCAVTIAGVFDWERVIADARYDQFVNPEYSQLRYKLGDPQKQQEKFNEISPARHVDQVKIPVFVSHGTDDDVVDVGESKRLLSELRKYKIPHESFIVGGEGHGMLKVKDDVELYTRIDAFLAKHLAPHAPAPTQPGGVNGQ